MNATNRALNRIVLLIVGVLLMAAGAAVILVTLWAPAEKVWHTVLDWVTNFDENYPISGMQELSWWDAALFGALLLVVILAIIVIANLGGGKSPSVIRLESDQGIEGPIVIRHGFAADAITHSLDGNDDIVSSKLHAARVKGKDVMQVIITPRQNVSPAETAITAAGLVDNLAALTGHEVPTLISIRGGVRAKVAPEKSRVS